MGGASHNAQDTHGEAALLLDILDLVLHSAAVAPTSAATRMTIDVTQADQAIPDDPSSIKPDLHDPGSTMSDFAGPSSTTSDLDDPSSIHDEQHQQQQQPASCNDSRDNRTEARQTVAQTDQYAASLLWGLRAVAAMAKQDGLTQPCAHMLTEYLFERVVLLSRDWPVEVGQAAAEVSMSHLHVSCWAILLGDVRCRIASSHASRYDIG